ncbi:hypothetical protein GQR58_028765 [Nymphon striatum]|nr:hypothetical protein GQR58_028765 [Nymphon striatum]
MKTRSDNITAKVVKAVKANHVACRFCLACKISSPKDGADDGNPKPRKSSAASDPITPATMKGRNVSVATMAFGSMCRNIIFVFDTPRARAARTYSKLRARKNSARTDTHKRRPPEQDRQEHQQPKTTPQDGEHNDDHIQVWRRSPNFQNALENQINSTAKEPLHSTRSNPDQRGRDCYQQGKDDRKPESHKFTRAATSRDVLSVPNQFFASGGAGAVPGRSTMVVK